MSFNGIAIGAVATIVIYHGMRAVAKYGPLKGTLEGPSDAIVVPSPASE